MIEPHPDRHHGDLLAIDPSLNSPGMSLFRHGVLAACGRIRIHKDFAALGIGARCLRVAQEIAVWYSEQEEIGTLRTIVFEWPQIYIDAKSKGDQNNLLGLVGVGQSLAAMFTIGNVHASQRPPEVVTPTPADWTGQLPKTVNGKLPKSAWESPRGARVRSKLQPGELRLVPDQHDAVDSLGLGLWSLGRYTLHRVFSGAV